MEYVRKFESEVFFSKHNLKENKVVRARKIRSGGDENLDFFIIALLCDMCVFVTAQK